MTMEQQIIEALKEKGMSNFQLQQEFKSSSADRIARKIRKYPPEGYYMEQRRKECDRYCLEYKLVKM